MYFTYLFTTLNRHRGSIISATLYTAKACNDEPLPYNIVHNIMPSSAVWWDQYRLPSTKPRILYTTYTNIPLKMRTFVRRSSLLSSMAYSSSALCLDYTKI